MSLKHVRAAIAALAAIVIAGVMAVPAQAAVGDIVTVTGTVTDATGAPMAALDLVVYFDSGAQPVSTGADGVYSVDLTLAAAQTWVSVSPVSWLSGVTCDQGMITSGPAVVTINCAIPNYVHVTVSGVGNTDNGSSPEGQMVTLASADNWFLGGGVMAVDGSFSFTAQLRDTVTEFYVSGPDGVRVGPFGPVVDGAEFSGVEFTFHPFVPPVDVDMTVQGRVLDKKGRPVVGAAVDVAGGYNGVHTVTDAQGYYTATGQWLWSDEAPTTEPVVVFIDGTIVEYVETLNPYSPTVVNYRVGKTPVYEPFATDLSLTDWAINTDVYRKVPASGPAEWYVTSDTGRFHFVFGSKKTELVDVLPVNDYAGTQEALLRDVRGGVVQWYRFGPDDGLNEQATFGYPRLDGLEYFDFVGLGGVDVVAWGDRGGATTVWTWGIADGIGDVQSTVLDGNFVSAHHANLNPDLGDEMVVVTHRGQKYTVSLLDSSSSAPVVVSSGRGAPTVTYADTDGDGLLNVVVTFG